MSSLLSHDDEEEELQPLETAYTKRRRTFGTAKPAQTPPTISTKEDSEPTTNNSQDNAAEDEDDVMIREDDDLGKGPKSKSACDLDDEGGDSNDDVILPNSQDSTEMAIPNMTPGNAATAVEDTDRADSDEEDNDEGSDEDDKNQAGSDSGEEDSSLLSANGNDNVAADENMTTTTKPATENTSAVSKKEKDHKIQLQPSPKRLRKATDRLYAEADKDSMTIKQIIVTLEEEFEFALSESSKKDVKERLIDLVNNRTTVDQDDIGELEVSSSEDEASSDEEQEEEPESDYEDEALDAAKRKRRPKNKKASSKQTTKEKDNNDAGDSSTRRKNATRKSRTKTAKLHKQAEKLRQKRIQELRVRNEELQLEQSKEDSQRAELIAAKFETNTEELRWQRLEDRLDLLQRLDQKRLQIIEVENMPEKTHAKIVKQEEEEAAVKEEYGSDSDDDDMELEIDGVHDAKQRLFPSFARSTALTVLDLADKASPFKGKKNLLANLLPIKRKQLSPSRNVNARAMLRNKLLKKQRKMGNMWLARELGYKNENEHLKDCIQAEKKKRDIVLQREAERLVANERTQMRARMVDEQEGEEEEAEFELGSPANNSSDKEDDEAEEDEELMLAKQVEREHADDTGTDAQERQHADDEAAADIPTDGEEDSFRTSENPNDEAEKQSSFDKDDESTKDETFPDAQGDDYPTESQVELTAEISPPAAKAWETTADIFPPDDDDTVGGKTEFQPLDTSPLLPTGDGILPEPEEPEDGRAAMDEAESQQFDTQAPSLSTGDFTMPGPGQRKEKGKPVREETESQQSSNAANDDGSLAQPETQAFDTQLFTPATRPMPHTETTNEPLPLEKPAQANASAQEPQANVVEDDALADTDDENECDDAEEKAAEPMDEKPEKDRNAGWKAMLQKEAMKLKQQKKRRAGNEFLETEADEEEEEEVAGLEDFGFSVQKKKHEDEENEGDDEINADDLKGVVDELSDDEGDEEKGEKARRIMLQREEKERHKDMMRRMRDGYDGRRGGIAGGGVGARGIHRFDQLVAADNRESAKQLGLLNDDELESDDEGKGDKVDDPEEEDEAQLLDKMLKDRFMHRSSVELEENFSEDEEAEEIREEGNEQGNEEEEKEQERLAKLFAKRARMQRLMDEFGDDEEFTDSRLIEEDSNMKEELSQMKNGLVRKRSVSSVSRTSSISTSGSGPSTAPCPQRQKAPVFGGGLLATKGSLSLALQTSRQQAKRGRRTSFLGSSQGSSNTQEIGIAAKSISFSHVVFQCGESQLSRGVASNSQRSSLSLPGSKLGGAGQSSAASKTSSLFTKVVMANGSQKRKRS